MTDAQRRIFRAPSAVVVLIASAAVGALLLVDAVARAGIVTGLLLAPWVLLALWGVYVFAFVSYVRTDAVGMRVQNLLRIVDVPWSQVSEIHLRWQLVISLRSGGVVRSFGGPVAGRPARPPRRVDVDSAPRTPPAVRDLEMIREQWEEVTEAGAPAGEVRRSWDLWPVLALGLILAWAVIAVLITGGPS